MLSSVLRFFCALTGLFSASAFLQAETSAADTWKLDSLTTIAGAPTELWGNPALTVDGAGASIRFNGKSDGLLVPLVPVANWKSFTIEILFSPDADGGAEQRFLHIQDEQGRRILIELRMLPDAQWCLDTFLYSDSGHRLALMDRALGHPAGRWYWAALTYDAGRMRHFVDGIKECEGDILFEPMAESGRTSLGVRQNKVSWFKGSIREVRFTPAALPAEKLQRVSRD